MNRILNTVLFTAISMTSVLAAAAETSTGSLTWSCSRQGVASYAEIKSGLGIANFHQARQAQLHIHQLVRRACSADSVGSVLLVNAPTQKRQGETRIAVR